MKSFLKSRSVLTYVFIVAIVLTGGLTAYRRYPKFSYVLRTSKFVDDTLSVEEPLTYGVSPGQLNFSLRITESAGLYDKVKLVRKVRMISAWPFISFDNTLTVQLVDRDGESQQTVVVYDLTGTLYDLTKDSYKLRIEDPYKNLIDEKVIELHAQDILGMWTQCESNDDCVPVSCTCTCAGCGGFDYEDVVNKSYEDAWYENAGCSHPEVCPSVCCSPKKILCVENTCDVVELDAE
jgi:hypothetical protein